MIEVLQSGTRTTLQDAGRPGHRHTGIPESGAADRLSFALANWMIGNPWDTPAIELTLGGQHFRFHADMTVALAGAEMWAQINGQNIENFSAFPVKSGDILTLSFARIGCRAYLALPGGVEGEEFLGSISTFEPAALGGKEGRSLKTGDKLNVFGSDVSTNLIPVGYKPKLSNHVVLRARPGPEFEELTLQSQRYLFINPYQATSQTNRQGARLKGNKIEMGIVKSMSSSPMLPGTVQVPADSQPILALADGHCTGGYPRILQIITADHWIMGQIGPGTKISFQRCFARDALDILKRRNAFYSGLIEGFRF